MRWLIVLMLFTKFIVQAQDTCVVEPIDTIDDYRKLKNTCINEKALINRTLSLNQSSSQDETIKEAGRVIHDLVAKKMLSAWYKTEWDFSGYTATPKEGKIACGYFVSTTLRDIGFNLDRYKLAQKSPLGEGRSLFLGEDPILIHSDSLLTFVSCLSDGLYFLGLSNHVGFLSIEQGELFFIHSNYIGAVGVMKERLECSEAVKYSSGYILVPLSTNKALVRSWLDNTRLTIYKE